MVVRIISKGNSIKTEPVKPSGAVLLSNNLIERQLGIKNFHGVKEKKKIKREPTLRQKGVIASVGKGRKSKAQILRENGYAPSTVDHPKRVFDKPVVAEAVEKTVSKIRRIRDKMLEHLEKNIEGEKGVKQSPYNLTVMSSILTKDAELLDGKPTDRTEYILPDEEKVRLDKLLEMNRKK